MTTPTIYPGACLRWEFLLDVGEKQVSAGLDIGGLFSRNVGATAAAEDYWMQPDSFVAAYEAALEGAIDAAASPAGPFVTVEMRDDGKLLYTNVHGSVTIRIGFQSFDVPLLVVGEPPSKANEDIAPGETYVSSWVAGYQWVAGAYDKRYATPQRRKLVSYSETATQIPERNPRSNDWYVTQIEWDPVAAARVHQGAADLASYAGPADITVGDENAPYENVLDHANDNGTFRIANYPSEASPSTDEWYLLSSDGEVKQGVSDDMLNDAMGLASFTMMVKMRRAT